MRINRDIIKKYQSPLEEKLGQRHLDKFRGCLLGGAAGDALGYEVEFTLEDDIFSRFGKPGITAYTCHNGKAIISDDTQMTLFTANGLLYGITRGRMRGTRGRLVDYIFDAYEQWYQTQFGREHQKGNFHSCWLMHVPELFAARAPGNTCLSAIEGGRGGTIKHPINTRKGCGGVMRVAPVGLCFDPSQFPILAIDLMAAEVAALTHGHEMGYVPGAMLAHIVTLLAHSEAITIEQAVRDSMDAMQVLFDDSKHMPTFLKLIKRAVELGLTEEDDLNAIHELGGGWVGDEALAIAIFCSVKYHDDFDKAMIAAVNHSGDSDSTGAIAGNILGAHLGLTGIPEKYQNDLELSDVILEMADDLYYGCQISEYVTPSAQRDLDWVKKYVEVSYRDE